MEPSIKKLDLQEVDHAIEHRPWLLSFDREIETQFEADTTIERCSGAIRVNLIGLFIYHCFLFGDYRVIGDVFSKDLFAHFGVVTPLSIATHFLLRRHPPAWLRDGTVATGLVIFAASILLIAISSASPDRDLILWAIIFPVLATTFVHRLRLRYALVACLAICVLFLCGSIVIGSSSLDRAIMSDFIFVGIILISMIGAYNLEQEERTGYLLGLRDRLRNKELETMSYRDALTGVSNRRALAAAFTALEEHVSTDPLRSTSIILLDIDHFKRFNDSNGHQAGDVCLRQVATIIQESLRQDEGVVYRYGGEEFLILLDGMTLNDAMTVAERVRLRIGDARLPRDSTRKSFVSVSAGIAAGLIGHNAGPASLVEIADAALYAAKRNGRDQIWPVPSEDTAETPFPERLAG